MSKSPGGRRQSASTHSSDLSRADGTKANHQSARKLYNQWAVLTGEKPFEELKEDDLKYDNLEELLEGFCLWIIDSPIPKQRGKGIYDIETLLTYFKAMKTQFKDAFPKLEVWPTANDSNPEWYSKQLHAISRAGKRNRMDDDGVDDQVYQGNKIRAMVVKADETFVNIQYRNNNPNFRETLGIDLDSAMISMMKAMVHDGTGLATARAQIVLTCHGMGRGSESKFIKVNELMWDDYYECLQATWRESKTVSHYPLLFVANNYDNFGFATCVYHSLACYFMIDKGLFRSEKHKTVKLFPQALKEGKAAVTSKLTNHLRAHTDPSIKMSTSMKSIRKGTTTMLAAHPGIDKDQRMIRSGHVHAKSNEKSEVYIEPIPALTLPTAKVLSGYHNPQQRVYSPRISCLPSAELKCADAMVDKMFRHVSFSDFRKGKGDERDGRLRPLLEACAATLIMYHTQVAKVLGNDHIICRKVRESLVETRLLTAPMVNPTLKKMSLAIKEDFLSRNAAAMAEGMSTGGGDSNVSAAMLQQLLNQISSLQSVVVEQSNQMEAQAVAIQQLTQAFSASGGVLSAPSTPQPAPPARLSSPGSVGQQQNAAEVEAPSPQAEHFPQQPPRDLFELIMFEDGFDQERLKSNKNISVSKLIYDIWTSGQLCGTDLQLQYCKLDYIIPNNRSKYKACLRLADKLIEENEWPLLRTEKETVLSTDGLPNQLVASLNTIEERCVDEIKDQLKAKTGSRPERLKGYFTGLGTKIIELENDKKRPPSMLDWVIARLSPASKKRRQEQEDGNK